MASRGAGGRQEPKLLAEAERQRLPWSFLSREMKNALMFSGSLESRQHFEFADHLRASFRKCMQVLCRSY